MRKSMMLLAAVAIVGAAAAIAADKDTADVEALIQKGLAAYKDGKVSDAISALQQAISAMQKSKEKGLAKMFRDPAALAAMNAGGKTTIKPFDKDGWSGWSTVEKDRNALAIAFYEAYVLNIDVNKDDAKTLDTFLGATDLKGIAGTTTSKPAK
jgi:hypothetical protein